MTPEDWRYVGAGALGIAGVAVWALGIRTRRLAALSDFGDPYCSAGTYQSVLGQHGTKSDKAYRAWYYAPIVINSAIHFGVPADIMMGIAHTESGFQPVITSPAGAEGLMQFMPKTGARVRQRLIDEGDWPFGALNRSDPLQSVWLAGWLMRDLLRNRRLDYAIGAYNAGPGGVDGKSFDEWPNQTQAYVPGVLKRAGYYRQIWEHCQSPAAAA